MLTSDKNAHQPDKTAPGPIRHRFRGYLLFSTAVATLALAIAVTIAVLALRASPKPDDGGSSRSYAFHDASRSLNLYFSAVAHDSDIDAAGALAGLTDEDVLPGFEFLSAPRDPGALSHLTARGQAALSARQIRFKGRVYGVNVTFYDCKTQGFCGTMYNGSKVYQGAAACSWNLQLGTRFFIVGDPTRRTYVCEDRGILENTWVDIFWNDPRDGWIWQSKVGRLATIEIIGLP